MAERKKFSIGDWDTWSSGGFIQEGDYALEFFVRNHQKERKDGTKIGEPNLSMIVAFHPLDGSPAKEQVYGCGNSAHRYFVPDPDTGKGFVQLTEGVGTMQRNCKFGVFMRHLLDAGLPPGLIEMDLSPLDGIHVHIQNVPAPEEWGQIQSSTSDAALSGAAQGGKPADIPVVTEILDEGRPWEGSGGIPEKGEEKGNGKGIKKAAPTKKTPVTNKPSSKAPAQAETGEADEAISDVALTALGDALEKKPDGYLKGMLRTTVFKYVRENYDNDTAQAVQETFFNNDEDLAKLLNQVSYQIKGPKVIPA